MIVSFLLLATLVPTASVLWFIDQSARSETAAARQTLMEAYRAQLRLVRSRVDSYWNERAALLSQKGAAGNASAFKQIVVDGLADSVVFIGDGGSIVYPDKDRASADEADPEDPEWQAARALEASRTRWEEAAGAYARLVATAPTPSLAARAAQGEIRCLVQSGKKEAAVRAIQQHFSAAPAARGLDSRGRLIAGDELLLSLQLLKPPDPRVPAIVGRLASIANDYDKPLPASQRLFLMNELQSLGADEKIFPTAAAERLAAIFIETDTARLDAHGFRRSRVPDLWTFTPGGSRLVALYRTERILTELRRILDQSSSPAVTFTATPPGGTPVDESISAGTLIEDWRIAFSAPDPRAADELARWRVAVNAWAGFLAIAVIAGSAVMLGRTFQRQLRLTRLKTDLVAAVSHELKTPLSSMRLLVDSLLDDRDLDPIKARSYLELIAGENLRLSRLIDNFLTFSRIERNRHRFEFADTDPGRVVAAAVDAMRERFQAASCHLTVETDPDLPALHADEDALATALLNLLDNACKYTLADKRIALRVSRVGSRLLFAVRDNGIGISRRDQKRIFRRFYRVDERLARDHGGCGLGLSIVEFIARAHGGTIAVDSDAGAGSTFTLSVPCRHERHGAAA